MSLFAHIGRCLELAERDIVSALAERRHSKALLDQLAKVSKPGDGAPKLLLVFARMAAQQVEWVDGAIRIEMLGDADVTVVEVLCELGLGMHERVFPSFKMNVPLDEFARAVERVPHMIEPLTIVTTSSRRLVLAASGDEDEQDDSPHTTPSIHDDSLYDSTKQDIGPAPSAPLEPAPKVPAPSGGHRAARKGSKPDIHLAKPGSTSPPSARPIVVPKAPAVPRSETAVKASLRNVVARVSLTKVAAPRANAGAGPARKSKPPGARNSRPPPKTSSSPRVAARASKPPPASRASKPPPANRASKPPPASRASKPPPANRASKPPPASRAQPPISEPPLDEEKIDFGWDDE